MPSRTTRSITLSGPDAASFANAQFGSDVLALAPGQWQWSAWLDPKGRVRALLQIARPEDERLVAVLRGGDAALLAADLQRFVFRSKVTIAVSGLLGVVDGAALTDQHVIEDEDGALVFGEGDASVRVMRVDAGSDSNADNEWIARHIHKGFAWLPDEALATLLPPALSMERLGAVAFNKGCFPGQEIAARLHFLGGHKKHLHIVKSDISLREGQSLRIDGKDVGIVLMQHTSSDAPTSLVVLDDAAAQAESLETETTRLHIVSTFAA